MLRSVARVWPLLLAIALTALFALPAKAELFYVTLQNGTVMESRYQPQEASWDRDLVLLMSDVGNWIGIPKDQVEEVRSESQNRGYGMAIDTATILLGFAPNDAADPNADPVQGATQTQDPNSAAGRTASALEAINQQRQRDDSYSVQQFVEPNSTQGIPSRFVSPTSSAPPIR
ncbi:MAG TPA: hypothetical protein VHU81_14220 [Thermoanaerobaculia bacterium]|nr:hypothetical protein [Thermoanaerobaculia bacterium]